MSIVGAFIDAAAARKVDSARAAALAAERQRQMGYDVEADVFNTRSQNRYQDFGGQQAKRGKQLGDYFASPPSTGGPVPMLPVARDALAQREVGTQLDKSKAYGAQQSAALGDVRSFGDLLGTVSRSQARDAGYVGQLGGFKRGSASIVPYELEAAAHAADKTKFWGDLIKGAENLATSFIIGRGLPGGGGAGAANFGAPGGGYYGAGGQVQPGPGYYYFGS